ncbi:glycerol-3-phosphate dehydrogenase [uncultured Enterovirga sp.]|uniref:glycerol-3-phosphate dehydrogenase n=1 Tax=uncultured Enterovirga sp. TaxID=2026352 RepID=UPI0035CC781F
MTEPYDLAIVGGGINGCGIARDAAGRGASVVLFEQGDLAGATSSASTKLIHGGLRYLEHYEFRLVREALREREVLLQAAPHIVWPLRFVLPYQNGLRPAWLLRLGLALYDHLGGRKILPRSRALDLTRDEAGAALKPGFTRGFEYSDCWVEDARLVVLNAQDAAERGASVRPRCRVVSAARAGGIWRIETEESGRQARVEARALVNAAGPWAGKVLALTGVAPAAGGAIRMVQGSHIVVPRLFAHERCYIFQNPDGRIVFAIPYERDFTLIGTTDRDYLGEPGPVAASEEEIVYLCGAASEHFREPVVPSDVVWTYSGVRALFDDGASAAQEATRDYVLGLDEPAGEPPLLSVFGGKITTYRRLAESAIAKLAGPSRPWTEQPRWTAGAPLPGGDFRHDAYPETVGRLRADYPFLVPRHAERLVRAYGTRAWRLLGEAKMPGDLGPILGADLTGREVDYLVAEEWARDAADILWRRSKLGLRLTPDDVARLEAYLSRAMPAAERQPGEAA